MEIVSSCQRLSLKRKKGCFNSLQSDQKRPRSFRFHDNISADSIGALFCQYDWNNKKKKIPSFAMLRLCKDLCISTMDVSLLVLSYKLNVGQCGKFMKEDFLNGLASMGIYSLAQLKEIIPQLRQYAKDNSSEIYRYAFHTLKEYESDTNIPLEGALEIMAILVPHLPYTYNFIHFMKTQQTYKVMNIDHWNMFLQFNLMASSYGSDFESYVSDEDVWPLMIDDFVSFMKKWNQESAISHQNSSIELCQDDSEVIGMELM